jgi:RecA-family ATPase
MKKEIQSKSFEIRKGIDLINQYEQLPEPKILWNGIIEGACGLITGIGKTGKTTFAENLAISLSCGKNDFYGSVIHGGPRRVLYINLEEKLWRIGRRNKKQIQCLTEEEVSLFCQNYYTAPMGFTQFLNFEEDWINLNKYITQVNPDVLFIDSLTHMFKGDIEKSAHAQEFIQKFKQYVLDKNRTVFIIHHNIKGNEKPPSQANIAGSRVITQEFDFALSFNNIPTSSGGTCSCMLYNKDAEKTSNIGALYEFDKNYWVHKITEGNIFKMYQDAKPDGRTSSKNKKRVEDYIFSQGSQGSQTISSTDLHREFVETNTMSKQTLYTTIDKLIESNLIERSKEAKGNYVILKRNDGDEGARQ